VLAVNNNISSAMETFVKARQKNAPRSRRTRKRYDAWPHGAIGAASTCSTTMSA
jgi:hypothetical protein